TRAIVLFISQAFFIYIEGRDKFITNVLSNYANIVEFVNIIQIFDISKIFIIDNCVISVRKEKLQFLNSKLVAVCSCQELPKKIFAIIFSQIVFNSVFVKIGKHILCNSISRFCIIFYP